MKRISTEPWRRQCFRASRSVRPHHLPRHLIQPHNHRRYSTSPALRHASTAPRSFPAASAESEQPDPPSSTLSAPERLARIPPEVLPSPDPSRASTSAKLAALHARLSLPTRLPLPTLARTLVDPSADPDPRFNNAALATLGADLLGYHTAEHLLCHHPRLPMEVLFAAQYAFVGPRALAAVAREWGVEVAAAPGGEVDPGLLQFRRVRPGREAELLEERRRQTLAHGGYDAKKGWLGPDGVAGNAAQGDRQGGRVGSGRPNEAMHYRRGISSRVVYDDQFGELHGANAPAVSARRRSDDDNNDAGSSGDGAAAATPDPATATLEAASKAFVQALAGAIYLHAGRAAARAFHTQHFLSRRLDLATLFSFQYPQRDLSRLCAREGFEPPVARLLSETGRLSRHPVFVVGVYSGRDELGQAAGASLDEARVRAAAAALKGWYLYRPVEVTVPSETEGGRVGGRPWVPNVPDIGEVIS